MGSLGPADRPGQYGQTLILQDGSPRDSPPVAKKRVCRVDGGTVGQVSAHRSSSALPKHFSLENQQILPITPGTHGMHGSQHGTHGHGGSARTGQMMHGSPSVIRTFTRFVGKTIGTGTGTGTGRKGRVHFSPHVTVYRMDEDGPICTECAALVTEPRDRQAFMARWMNRAHQRRVTGPVYGSDVTHTSSSPHVSTSSRDGKSVVTVRMPPSPPSDTSYISSGAESLPSGPEVLKYAVAHDTNTTGSSRTSHPNFTFVEDASGSVRLKFVLPLGTDYSANDVIVKANMSGNRVRVIANKTVRQGTGCHVTEQFNERYQVPMQVDPYKVSARLDIKGNLTVEAPLLSLDKRETLNKH